MATEPDDDLQLRAAIMAATETDSVPVAAQKALAALTKRERMAVNLWRSGQATSKAQACRDAGYTEATAARPSVVFKKLKVRLALELSQQAEEPSREVTAESYLMDLVELAHTDPLDAIDDEGKVKKPRDWPPALRRMVQKIDFDPIGGIASVTFGPRAPILQMLGKHRLVSAFDQKAKERRIFVIRDYTGRTQANEREEERDITDLVERVESDIDKLEFASEEDVSDIDRGFIPEHALPR